MADDLERVEALQALDHAIVCKAMADLDFEDAKKEQAEAAEKFKTALTRCFELAKVGA